jgi:hypothetical protein
MFVGVFERELYTYRANVSPMVLTRSRGHIINLDSSGEISRSYHRFLLEPHYNDFGLDLLLPGVFDDRVYSTS